MFKKSVSLILTAILMLSILVSCKPAPVLPPSPPAPVPTPAPIPGPGTTPPPQDKANDATEVLSRVVQIPQLNFELADFIGQKVWTWGFYGDGRFSERGVGFLVLNYNMMLVDERLGQEGFIRLDGKMPPSGVNSAEILIYGEIKDFGKTYGAFTMQPTPLLTVEEYYVLDDTGGVRSWQESALLSWLTRIKDFFDTGIAYAEEAAGGTKASACDRSLIISGGIDDNNNKPRYKDNVVAKYKKMKELGFTDGQIGVFYNDGGTITVNGANITDGKSSKAKIKETLEKYKNEMNPSCTLTIFVTDHGTGYNTDQGYDGARPVLDDSEGGKTYAENTFKIDLKKKVYRQQVWTNGDGVKWWVYITKETNQMVLYKKVGAKWEKVGTDANNNGRITESETNQDVDGDGDKDGLGWNQNQLGPWKYRNNNWDTDGDGTNDVRARWDGTRFVIERKDGAAWKEMGRDTNGDFIIDGTDGGVDWNLDGDKSDQVGFHEGINLWGSEVLWDDELTNMLKPLRDKGIHIVFEMVSCFSGGFVDNLSEVVEGVVAGSSEDTKHWNRVNAAGKVYAADEMAFLENLKGIDVDSWMAAWEKAKAADKAAWVAGGSDPVSQNHHQQWSKPLIESESTFHEVDGEYIVNLKLPASLKDKVHDMEIFFGMQKPRWEGGGDFFDWPDGMTTEKINGGVKILSEKPFPMEKLTFRLKGAKNAESMRIHITDKTHKNLGYISPKLTEAARVTQSLEEDAMALGELFGSIDGAAGTERDTSDPVDFTTEQLEHYVSIPGGEMLLSAEALLAFMQQAILAEQQVIAALFTEHYQTAYQIEYIVRVAVLNAPISMSAESYSNDSSCSSTITIAYSATITGGEGLLTIASVVLKVNGETWGNSGGLLVTDSFSNTVSRQVGCGQTFNAELIVTTSHGDIATTTASMITPIP
ncbi:hypothetical protein ACFLXH_00380 [Chloroflexota bacterium]